MRVWDVGRGELVAPALATTQVIQLAISHDGQRLATAAKDGTVRVWDADTGQPLTLPLTPGEPLRRLIFSREGDRLLMTSVHRPGARLGACPAPQPTANLVRVDPGAGRSTAARRQRGIDVPGRDGSAAGLEGNGRQLASFALGCSTGFQPVPGQEKAQAGSLCYVQMQTALNCLREYHEPGEGPPGASVGSLPRLSDATGQHAGQPAVKRQTGPVRRRSANAAGRPPGQGPVARPRRRGHWRP